MIDHTEHIKSVVKDELAKACTARGIDKRQAGFAIGGFGDIGLVPVGQGTMAPLCRWSVTISLPAVLLGQDHQPSDSLCVAGTLPTDNEFRATVRRLVAAVDDMRQGKPVEPEGAPEQGTGPSGLFVGKG